MAESKPSHPAPQTETVKAVEEMPEKVMEPNITTVPEKDEIVVKRRGRRKLAEVIQKLEPELATAATEIIPDAKPEKTLQSTKSSIVVANKEKLEKSPAAAAVPEKEVESSQEKVVKPRGRKKVSEILEKLTKEKLLGVENDQPPPLPSSPSKLNETSKQDEPKVNVGGQKSKSRTTGGTGSGTKSKEQQLVDEKRKKETLIVEPEAKEDEKVDVDIDITKTIGGQIGRTAKKIRKMQKHVNLLLEYQEQQKRFRSRSLLDSQDALNILKKYRRKKPRIFSASSSVTSNTKSSLVLKLKREHRKPYHAIEKNLKNPLKFKLIKKPPTLVVDPNQNKQEKQEKQQHHRPEVIF